MDIDPTILDASCKDRPKAPGMRYRHYAPKADMCIVRGEDKKVIDKIKELVSDKDNYVIISVDEHMKDYEGLNTKNIGSISHPDDIASNLYRILRECDDEEVTYIASESFDDKGIGAAIMNRLIKAAGHKIINA